MNDYIKKTELTQTSVMPFSFGEHEIRVIQDEHGEPWFVATEIAKVLGYRDASNMIRGLDDDEKGTRNVSTLGGNQVLSTINESGLYSAILSSRKKEAKPFKKWVTRDVLPSIRKHGMYAEDDLLDNPDLLIKTATRLKEERELRLKAEAKIEADAPKVEFAEKHNLADGWFCLRDAAKQVGYPPKKFNDWLHANNYTFRQGGKHWMPYSEKIKSGLFKVRSGIRFDEAGEEIATQQCMVTAKGIQHFTKRLTKEGLIAEVSAC